MKIKILIGSGIFALAFLILDFIGTFRLCGGVEYGRCMDTLHGVLGMFVPVFPLFLFSLITYFMREDIYKTWVKFAIPWTVLSMFLIFLAPAYGPSGFGPAISLDKSFVALIMSALSAILSTLIIATRYLLLRFRNV